MYLVIVDEHRLDKERLALPKKPAARFRCGQGSGGAEPGHAADEFAFCLVDGIEHGSPSFA
jgi:hypothetical protein